MMEASGSIGALSPDNATACRRLELDPSPGAQNPFYPGAEGRTYKFWQQSSVAFLVDRGDTMLKSAIIAHDTGMGKTVTAYLASLRATLEDCRRHATVAPRYYGPTLLVCPPQLVRNWDSEASHLFPNQFRVVRFYTPDARGSHISYVSTLERLKGELSDPAHPTSSSTLVLTTYKTWTQNTLEYRHADHIAALLADPKNDIATHEQAVCFVAEHKETRYFHTLVGFPIRRLILDEAHGLKDPNSQQSLAVSLLPGNHTRWLLTATPLSNRTTDVLGLAAALWRPEWGTTASLARPIRPLDVQRALEVEETYARRTYAEALAFYGHPSALPHPAVAAKRTPPRCDYLHLFAPARLAAYLGPECPTDALSERLHPVLSLLWRTFQHRNTAETHIQLGPWEADGHRVVGSEIPHYTVSTVELGRTHVEEKTFMDWYPVLWANRVMGVGPKNATSLSLDDTVRVDARVDRELSLLSFDVQNFLVDRNLRRLSHGSLARWFEEENHDDVKVYARLLQIDRPDLPAYDTRVSLVMSLLIGSPKLRYLVGHVVRTHREGRRMLLFTFWPWSHWKTVRILELLGVHVASITAEKGLVERMTIASQ